MPPDQPLSPRAHTLLVRLCRSPDGLSLESLEGEAVAAAGELYDAGAVTADGDTIRPLPWAVVWAKAEPEASEYEVSETDLAGAAERRGKGSFGLDGLADPRAADPIAAASTAEAEARRDRTGDYGKVNLPRPTVILGLSGQWPEVNFRIPCGGCGGRKLPKTWYCAANGCDRSGLDNIIGVVKPLPPDKPAGPKREWPAPRDTRLAGGTGPVAGVG